MLLLVAACSTGPKPPPARPAPAPAPPPAQRPVDPGQSPLEAAWHVRAGLNVAALSCTGGNALARDYNLFLQRQKAPLARAYAEEQARYRAAHGSDGQRELDRHMTKLYNHFAWPPAQQGFCAAAKAVVADALATASDRFEAYAPAALARLDQPISNPMQQAAAPAIRTTPKVEAAAAPKPAPGPAPATPWRIQLGAFSSQAAAETAWGTISRRAPGIAAYQPRFEKVPGKPLVRLQLDAGLQRDEALRLCAVAAASGFDCLPVAS
jgi:hypothetical protein